MVRSRTQLAVGAALLLAALAPVPAAHAQTTLDFSDTGVGEGHAIPSTYGSGRTQATVENRARAGFGNSGPHSLGPWMCLWNGGYSGLEHVAYVCNTGSGVGEFAFTPDSGYRVTLQSLQIGSWLSVARAVTVRVYDWDWTLLFDASGTANSAPVTFNPNVSSSQRLYLQFGDTDPYNTAIDNITFRVEPTVTPEPVSMALLGTGLAGIGAVGRRRRKVAG